MRYAEPTAARRRIGVYLIDDAGDPVIGAIPAAGQLLISKSGGAFYDGAGTWTERGNGLYFYEATISDVSSFSYMFLLVLVPGAKPFPWIEDIDTRIIEDEPLATKRHIPIYLVDDAGDPVPGLTLSGAEVQVSKAGGALATAAGTVAALGEGFYDYEAPLAEVDTPGPLVLMVYDSSDTARRYLYTMDVVTSTSGDVGGSLISITASPISRWTPVIAIVSTNDLMMVVFESVQNRFTIYDDTRDPADKWSAFFEDRSGVEDMGDGTFRVTILPNGGWWNETFKIRISFIGDGTTEAEYALQ